MTAKTDRAAGCDDLVWVATPPYRSYNARYLNTSYGASAREALAFSPRDFSFALHCADYKTEERWVTRLLWPNTSTEKELDEARQKLGASAQGKGRLWIRDSRIVRVSKARRPSNPSVLIGFASIWRSSFRAASLANSAKIKEEEWPSGRWRRS